MTEISTQWDKVRTERNKLLNDSDWIQWPKGSLSCDMYAKWIVYRQQLRDITKLCNDPAMVVYPLTPVETVAQQAITECEEPVDNFHIIIPTEVLLAK